MVTNDTTYILTESNYSDAIGWLEEQLSKMKVPHHEMIMAELLLEENFYSLSEVAEQQPFEATISLHKRFGNVKLRLSAEGKEFNPLFFDETEGDDPDHFSHVDILRSYHQYLNYVHRGNKNIVEICVHKSETKEIRNTLLGLVCGLLLGVLLKQFADVEVLTWINYNVLDSLQLIFMKALILVVTPMIFFSIITGISSMSDITYIKRIGGKLVAYSLLKLSFYIVVGMLIGHFIGVMPQLLKVFQHGGETMPSTLSLRNLIVDVVPGSIMSPFAENHMLQTLFLAFLFGIMLSRPIEHMDWAKKGVEFMSSLTIDVLGVISKCIPLVVMVSMIELMIKTDISILLSYGKLIIFAALGLPLSLLVSSALVALFGHTSPMDFLSKISRFIVLPFSTSNSSVCMPATMKFCIEKLGMEKNYVRFSISMGMQFNMAGTAFYVAIISIMMVHTFGINLSPDFLFSLFVAELFLALTGVGIIAMPTLLGAMGIPTEAIMFFIGIEPLMDMPGTAHSVTENITSSYLVACQEKRIRNLK